MDGAKIDSIRSLKNVFFYWDESIIDVKQALNDQKTT